MPFHCVSRSALLAAGLATCTAIGAATAQDVTGANLTLSGVITQNGAGTNFFNGAMSSFDGSVCLGNSCASTGETNGSGNPPLKLKWTDARIIFEDTSTTGFADRDWTIGAAGSAGQETFSIVDEGVDWTDSTQVTPFTIVGGAPANAFWLDDTGNIGLGTSMPMTSLHISDLFETGIRFESTSTGDTWDILNLATLTFADVTNSQSPFRIFPNAGSNILVISNAGNGPGAVGIGTAEPQGWLTVESGNVTTGLLVQKGSFSGVAGQAFAHFRTDQGTAQLMVEETSATTLPRTLINLQNNGRPEIVMGNTDTNGEWSFGAGTNFILKQGAVGTDSSVKTNLFQISPTGDATLAGSLTTGGTTCGGGCDRVFDADYPLPSITDHAAQMRTLGYLPNVGPTPEGAPINVTDKLGRVLNELEHAHIYITELEGRVARLEGLLLERSD